MAWKYALARHAYVYSMRYHIACAKPILLSTGTYQYVQTLPSSRYCHDHGGRLPSTPPSVSNFTPALTYTYALPLMNMCIPLVCYCAPSTHLHSVSSVTSDEVYSKACQLRKLSPQHWSMTGKLHQQCPSSHRSCASLTPRACAKGVELTGMHSTK